jgi:hypothetical protein
MKHLSLAWLVCSLLSAAAQAAVPLLLNHQGRIAVSGTNFQGTGQFKFALVNANGSTTYWSNDGTSSAGSQPSTAVSLQVTTGLYSVILGDTALPNMAAIPSAVFENTDVRLRIWFNDGINGSQHITPDQRLVAAPYALNAARAESVPDASITSVKLASGLTLAGTTVGSFSGSLTGSATDFTGSLAGDVTGTQTATTISSSTVTAKLITGFSSGAGTITASDTLLSAINKLHGNDALKAPLASPTFTGTVTATAFSGSGSALTGLNGANISSGTVGSSQIANLTIVNADISASAAIVDTKLATLSTAGKVANSATTGTAANTASALVLRDGSGNFSAGTVTGTFVGDGSGLTGVVADLIELEDVIAPPVKPVVAWGDNDVGQITVPTLANVADVAAGNSHSIALLDAGTVIQWGAIAAAPGTAVDVTHIAAGAEHNLVRRSDGTVIAWGANSFGQSTVPNGITTATNVSAGEKHSLVVKADGTVQGWGDNTFGQTTIPVAATTVTAIASGYDHNLALKADGTVVAWGRNDAGQTNVPGGLNNVVLIACGAYHSLAVKSDGSVVAWGWDSGGQVSGASGITNVSKVAGGYAFSLALKNDGTLVAWGDNTEGQTLIPSAATQVTQVAAGASHALALRADFIPAQVARLDQDNIFTGKVGIKRTPAVNALEVEGNASKSTAGTWFANSDRRIKEEVMPLTGAVEKLGQIRLVDFSYTDDYLAAHPGVQDRRYLNVIAQEFQKVFPEHVQESGERLADGSAILQVDTYPLTIYSAAAVQELAKENAALRKALATQEERLRRLEERLK